jgi:DNA-binding transcriptional ArsR family regulator
MNVTEMEQKAEQISGLMRLLANPNRLMILCLLVEGEKSVGELARALEMRDAAVSQQLAMLRRDGIIRGRRDGHSVYYVIQRKDVREMMAFLYQSYCQDLSS